MLVLDARFLHAGSCSKTTFVNKKGFGAFSFLARISHRGNAGQPLFYEKEDEKGDVLMIIIYHQAFILIAVPA